MARTARKQSYSGVYHAILRGVNKQQIFECTEDYQRFLKILRAQTLQEQDEAGHRSKPHCVIYAYCQMGNHVHLLIKESGETLAQSMKRISSSYVYYYNHKYGRIGHLFQNTGGAAGLNISYKRKMLSVPPMWFLAELVLRSCQPSLKNPLPKKKKKDFST